MPRTTTVHLLTGDYPDRLEAVGLEAQQALADKTPRTALEGDPYAEIEERYKALKAEAIEAGTSVHLVAVGRRIWRSLKETHPPRSGEGVPKDVAEGDRLAGVNTDEVEDDLIHASTANADVACAGDMRLKDRACTAENRCTRRTAFDDWADGFSEGEWQVLVRRAWELANGARLDPKDLPPSPTRSED